jgi:hypothetical protein
MTAIGRTARAGIAALGMALGIVALGVQPGSAGSGVPFQDPNQVGSIGFCNQAGQSITQGSLSTTPFVWRAVSSEAAQAPYNGPGRVATLFAYQPRLGLAPGQFSGEEITAASRYTNPAHPMAAATDKDESLEAFVQNYPVSWDGLVQIRMYLGAPDQPAETTTYAATDIQVTGNTWHVVQGATVPCNSSRAVSVETILAPVSTASPSAKPHPSTVKSDRSGHSSKPAAGGSGDKSAGARGSAASADPTDAASQTATSSSGHSSAVIALLVALVLALLAIGYVAARRRRISTSTPSSSDHRTSKKGR